MKSWLRVFLSLLLATQVTLPAISQPPTANEAAPPEPRANVVQFPTEILRTGVNLTDTGLSANTRQLAETIGITSVLERLQKLRERHDISGAAPSLESLAARQDLWEAKQEALLTIMKTDLEIDFAISEIDAETEVYNEILAAFASARDQKLARINAASFISNGILWTICEGMAIPSFNTVFAKNPKHVVQWPIPSGIIGIAAGIVPSLASMYTLRAVNGKITKSEVDPNMLAKLFGYPTNSEIEYPNSVWQYLNQVPADNPKSKRRLDQIIDRWITDANMPEFTDRKSKHQLDVLTASVSQRKGLSIATLQARSTMLQQLHSELMKMKRMLLELTMVVQGEKKV
jgi:hypothetical protein